jgi:hypothetical protein
MATASFDLDGYGSRDRDDVYRSRIPVHMPTVPGTVRRIGVYIYILGVLVDYFEVWFQGSTGRQFTPEYGVVI